MGKTVKSNLRRLIALVMAMALIVPAALAEETAGSEEASGAFTYESELLNQESYMQYSNFVLDDWAAARCGYSESRKIYRNDTEGKSFMQFTAPEGKKFTSAEFLVTLHHNSSPLLERADEQEKRVFVSQDGIDWTAEKISIAKDEKINVDGGANHYNYTVSADIPTGAKYVRLQFGWANGTWQIFVHHAKLSGDEIKEEPVFESSLITTPDNVTQNGFESVFWAAARCGYSETRDIWYAGSGANAIFDAGEGNAYTSGEFDITANRTKFWMIEQDAYRNGGILKASDDGESWVNIASAYTTPVTRDDSGNVGDDNAWRTTKLSFKAGKGYRYIKFDTQVGTDSLGGNLFLHNAVFYGGAAAAEPLYASELRTAEDGIIANGFSFGSWAGVRCGYASDRPMYISAGTSDDVTENSLTFTAPDAKLFTNAEFLVTLHAARTYLIDQANYLSSRIMVSADGITWEKAPNVYAAKDPNTYYDGTNAHYNYTLSAEIPKGAKYVKVSFTEVGGWQAFVHNVKLYGGKAFEVTKTPQAVIKDGVAEITASYETINADGETVYAAVYDGGKLAGIGKAVFGKSRNAKNVSISVNTNGAENPECKMFIWSGGTSKPMTGMLSVSVE